MKKLCLLTATLLLSSAWMFAQSTSQSGGYGSSSQSSSSGNETTIEGCLSGSSGNFTLSDKSGKTYQLQGDTSKLEKEVGHQVRVKGTESGTSASTGSPSGSSQSSGSNSGMSPSSSSSGSSSAGTPFNVSKVSKISDNCSASPSNK